jgi:carbon monoxide dehydrogenase subunit G
MIGIQRSIAIHAPAARVFEQLDEPDHLLEIWPSLAEVSNARVEPDGRHAFDWAYRMAGVRFRGHCDTVEIDRGRRRVDHNEGGIPSTFRWTFEPRGPDTDVKLEIDYELPGLLGFVAGPVLRVLNEREAETLLQNLKLRIETGVTPVARDA